MVFLLQIGAVLMAGSLVALAWTARPGPPAIARSIVVVAAAFSLVAFWGHVWQIGKAFRAQRAQWRLVAQPELAGTPTQPDFQGGFAEWIRERIKPGDRFYIVPSPTRDDAVVQWFTYRLLPNLMSARPEQADWLIFYGTYPLESGYSRFVKGIAERYGQGYSLARTRHAG
jgi:xanthosine utilization system XapX-like protein